MDKSDRFSNITEEITNNDVVLFMKLSPMFPQCGFSAAVVQILSKLEIEFKGIDVLEDDNSHYTSKLKW